MLHLSQGGGSSWEPRQPEREVGRVNKKPASEYIKHLLWCEALETRENPTPEVYSIEWNLYRYTNVLSSLDVLRSL